MKLRYFGTDGIRGTVGKHPIVAGFARDFAHAVDAFMQKRGLPKDHSVLIARDTRASGEELASSLMSGFEDAGRPVVWLGVVPTPFAARCLIERGGGMAVVLTASHNPASDNGFKLFASNGCKLDPEDEAEIEAFLDARMEEPLHHRSGFSLPDLQAPDPVDFAKGWSGQRLDGMRIALDTANGAASVFSPVVLRHLGATVFTTGDSPDGRNINEGVGSEFPDNVARLVKEHNCDLGFAHDGDGDRVIAVDHLGRVLSGEHFMGIVSTYCDGEKAGVEHPLVTTIQSNLGLDVYLEDALGASVIRTDVGDRNVSIAMRDNGVWFGGENSGHYVFRRYLPTGDGLVALLKLIEAVRKSGRRLADLVSLFRLFPSRMINLRLADKIPLDQLSHLKAVQERWTSTLGGRGRLLVRYSGTEAKIRLLAECPDSEQVERALAELSIAARKDLRVLE